MKNFNPRANCFGGSSIKPHKRLVDSKVSIEPVITVGIFAQASWYMLWCALYCLGSRKSLKPKEFLELQNPGKKIESTKNIPFKV